jgi:flagellar FliJ protein
MAKFNFELDTVLNYKKQSESNKMNQLTNEINNLNFKMEDLDEITGCLENAKISFDSNMRDNISILNMQTHYSYINNLDRAKKNKEKDIDNQTLRVENTRRELIDIARSKKTLEILEDKKFENFKKELTRIEQNENDERSSYNHSRKNTI